MKPKNVIVWILLLAIIVLLLSTDVQAQELTEVSASDILEQIEKGEDIYLDNIWIMGKLDLSEIKLNKTTNIRRSDWQKHFFALKEKLNVVDSTIIIKNSVFEKDVDFSNTQFENDVDFYDSSFLGSSYFNGTVFKSYIANFNRVNFSGDTCFYGANFSGEANFNRVNFSGDTCFHDASFSGPHADFRYTHFGRKADFTGAIFRKNADFKKASFAGEASFLSTEFDEVLFTGTTFTNVSLEKTDYNQMNVEWSTLKDALVFDVPAYKKLIKKFEDMGQFEDAKAASYQHRLLSQADKEWSLSKLMDLVARVFFGYGLKPGNIVVWVGILIIVFALVYWRGEGIRRLKENDGANNRVTFWDAIYFSASTISTVGYGDWYPVDRYRIWVMLEGFLGWLFLALFIATFTDVILN